MTPDWKFNKHNPPRFWFGDQVKFHDWLGTVYGMKWREEMARPDNGKLRHGWWYRIRWDGCDSLQGVHESNLIPVKN